jgi:alanyl-tRNA synthetase
VELVREAAGVLGGGGGGRADLAQAGAGSPERLEEAFEAARRLLKSKLLG